MRGLPRIYRETANLVADAIRAPTWLVGGWLLAAERKRPYVGDVDILAELAPEGIARNILGLFPSAKPTSRNGFRIPIAGRNHIDVHSTASLHQSGRILDALNAFPFTANGVAHLIGGPPKIAMTQAYEEAVASGTFEFSPFYKRAPIIDRLSLLRDGARLEAVYDFCPTAPTATYLKELRSSYELDLGVITPASVASWAAPQVDHLIPRGAPAWLCRGAIRTARLGVFDEWDDLDVLVECRLRAILDHLNETGVHYAVSYHGTPKVRLSDGRHVDLIPTAKNETVGSSINEFFPSTEKCAVNLATGETCGLSTQRDVDARILGEGVPIQALAPASKRYLALKSLYLAQRHNLALAPSLKELVLQPMYFSYLDLRNATRQAQELQVRGGRPSVVDGRPVGLGARSAVSLFRRLGVMMTLDEST